MNAIISLLLVILILVIIYLIITIKKQNESSSSLIQNKINEALRTANEDLIKTAQRVLESDKKEISVDMRNKREEINRLVELVRQDIKESKEKLNTAEQERIRSFSALQKELEEHKLFTKELAVSTENLKKILSNNQMRGQFGEQVAEDLLRMAGFTRGVDYDYNIKQDSSQNRADFIIYLPDKTKINVDVKFPYANLQKYTETNDKEQKKALLKQFEKDVKEKIKQVSTRDYINPEDKTVDFVILFIPNEMIFSFIYDQLPDVWQIALSKKVVLTGPFSFTAILRMVRQAYRYFSFQKNLQEILRNVQAFSKEFNTFSEAFFKIGSRIESLSKQYNEVSTTRFNKLVKVVDKIDTTMNSSDILITEEDTPRGINERN